MKKQILANGQKARQRNDKEDRTIVYHDWLRTVDTGGYFCDADILKWRDIEGKPTPVAVTELTRCDRERIGPGYLRAIEQRWFHRDRQGAIFTQLGKLLGCPVYIVLFQKEMKWIWVFSFQQKQWKEFTPQGWGEFLKSL